MAAPQQELEIMAPQLIFNFATPVALTPNS